MTAEAPSLSELELPAVTIPSGRTTGRSPARTSRVVSARGPSSVSTEDDVLPRFTCTATISSAKRPAPMAASARWWERSAKASASSRVILSSAASSSAVSGME